MTVAASEPFNRFAGSGILRTSPINDLREIPTKMAFLRTRTDSRDFIICKLYSYVFELTHLPIPGSIIILFRQFHYF